MGVMFNEPSDSPDIVAVKDALKAQIAVGKIEISVAAVFTADHPKDTQICMRFFEPEIGGYGVLFFFPRSADKDAGNREVLSHMKPMKTYATGFKVGDRMYNFKSTEAGRGECQPYANAVFRVEQDLRAKHFNLVLGMP